jgi:hypothetical protein
MAPEGVPVADGSLGSLVNLTGRLVIALRDVKIDNSVSHISSRRDPEDRLSCHLRQEVKSSLYAACLISASIGKQAH